MSTRGANQARQLELPSGYRFHPTDEELLTNYLIPKVLDPRFSCVPIMDVSVNESDPWDLPVAGNMGEREQYYFIRLDMRDTKNPRVKRTTPSGYWKSTGRGKTVISGRGVLLGRKKIMVFYAGRSEKTPWVMHEYGLEGNQLQVPNLPDPGNKEEWVISRVFNRDLGAPLPFHLDEVPHGASLPELPFSAATSSSGAVAGFGHHQLINNQPPPLPEYVNMPTLPMVPQSGALAPAGLSRGEAGADMASGSSLYPELENLMFSDGFSDLPEDLDEWFN